MKVKIKYLHLTFAHMCGDVHISVIGTHQEATILEIREYNILPSWEFKDLWIL